MKFQLQLAFVVFAVTFLGSVNAMPPIANGIGSTTDQGIYRDLFVRGSDGNVWWSGGNGGAWSNLGTPNGVSIGKVAGVSIVSTHYPDAFMTGSDGNLWEVGWTGSTFVWINIGKPSGSVTIVDTVGSVVNNNDYPAVFVTGSDGNLWYDGKSGSTWVWSNLGKPTGVSIIKPMGVAVVSGGKPYAYVTGSDGNLWLKAWNGSSWSWSNLGKPGTNITIASAVGTVVDNNKDPGIFVIGSDGNLWWDGWNGSAWVWSNLGTPTGVGLSVSIGATTTGNYTTQPPVLPRAYLTGSDGNLWVCYWNVSSWGWGNVGRPSQSVNIIGSNGVISVAGTGTDASFFPEAYVIGSDGNIWQMGQNGTSNPWQAQSNVN